MRQWAERPGLEDAYGSPWRGAIVPRSVPGSTSEALRPLSRPTDAPDEAPSSQRLSRVRLPKRCARTTGYGAVNHVGSSIAPCPRELRDRQQVRQHARSAPPRNRGTGRGARALATSKSCSGRRPTTCAFNFSKHFSATSGCAVPFAKHLIHRRRATSFAASTSRTASPRASRCSRRRRRAAKASTQQS